MASFVRLANGKVEYTDNMGLVYGLDPDNNVIPLSNNENLVLISDKTSPSAFRDALRVDWRDVTVPIVTSRDDLVTKLTADFFFVAGQRGVTPFVPQPDLPEFIRRFRTRTDGILTDSVAGRSAVVIAPVSSFNGINSYVNYSFSNISTTSLSTVVWININMSGIQRIISSTPLTHGFSERDLFVHVATSSGVDNNIINNAIIDNLSVGVHSIIITRESDNYNRARAYIDGVLITESSLINSANGTMSLNLTTLGSPVQSINGFMTDVAVYSKELTQEDVTLIHSNRYLEDSTRIYYAPLPHYGIGFDEDNNTIDFRSGVTNVTEDYAEGGSLHMINNGAVNRQPELFSSFTTPPTGWADNGDGTYTFTGTSDQSISETISGIQTGAEFTLILEVTENEGTGINTVNFGTGNAVSSVNLPIGEHTIIGNWTGSDNVLSITGIANERFTILPVSLKINRNFIPNKPNGTPSFSLVDGDTFVPSSSVLNETPYFVRFLSEVGIGDELFPVLNFQDGNWLIGGQGIIDSSNGFSSTSFGGIRRLNFLTIGKTYVLRITGNSTIGDQTRIFNHANSPLNQIGVLSSGIIVFTAITDDLYIRNNIAGIVTNVTLSIRELPEEVAYFAKNDPARWDQFTRDRFSYDSDNVTDFFYDELTDEYHLDHNIQTPDRTRWRNRKYRDLILYQNLEN